MLYSVGKIGREPVVFVGVDFKKFKKVAPLWTIQGEVPFRENEALLGIGIYKRLKGEIGERIELEVFPRRYDFKVVGYFSTGGAEDYQIFIPLKEAQRITNKEHLINFVLAKLDLPSKK